MGKYNCANSNQKKAGVSILISDNVLLQNKEDYPGQTVQNDKVVNSP